VAVRFVSVTAVLLAALTPPVAAHTLVALTADGALVVFRTDRPAATSTVEPRGLSGRLIGIDTRPAGGRLYGVTTTNDVYRLDATSGEATLVSTLTVPFDGAERSGVDFTPQADRLRLLSADGQNLRVNVDLGATATDGALVYAAGDANAGRRPRITAAAYTNAVAGAATTILFEIDAALDVLAVQEPPNDGVLRTVGPLGVDFGPHGGFDIVTEAGGDRAYAASGATLYAMDLTTGAARSLGTIGDGSASVVSLAVSAAVAAPGP
jgi:hypothetical protein